MLQRRHFLGASALATAGLAAPAVGQSRQRVRMAQAIDAVDFLPLYIARDRGFFQAEGIDLEITVTNASGPDVAALLAREVDFAATAPQPMFNVAAQGQRVLGIFNIARHTSIQFLIDPTRAREAGMDAAWDLPRRLGMLRGARIGITRPGALTDSLTRHYLRSANLSPGRDVQIVAVGAGASMMAALENRQVDVIASYSPIAQQQLVTGKATMLIDVSRGEDPEIRELLGQVLAIRPDFAERSEATVRRVIGAFTRATRWVNAASDAEVADVVAKFFPTISREALVMTAAHQKRVVPIDGRLTREGVETAMRMHVAPTGPQQIPPFDALFTNRFLMTGA